MPVSGNDWFSAALITASDQQRDRTSVISGFSVGLLMADLGHTTFEY